jgi:hypothetical protein
MKISADGEKLFISDDNGNLKLISLIDATIIRDFGKVCDHEISGIVITVDERFFFTSTVDGRLIQWNYGNTSFFRQYRRITGGISSLCL